MDNESQLGYLHTLPVEPYKYTTVTRAAKENALLRPKQEIFILRDAGGTRSSLTNASLYQQAEHLARYLVTRGVKKGDVVALVGPNTLEMIIGMLGIMTAGAVVLNITISTKTVVDLKDKLCLTNVKCMLLDCGSDNNLFLPIKAILQHCNVQTDSVKEADRLKLIFMRKMDIKDFQNTDTFETIQLKKLDQVDLPYIFPEDNALIFMTSGSTGKPKMALHSHFSLTSTPFFITDLQVDYGVIVYNDRPFAWSGGSPVFTILRGETRVLMNAYITMNSQNTDFLWGILKEEKCTHALLLPFAIQDLLGLPKTATVDGYKLQQVATGGQMINDFHTGIMGQFCHRMMIVYGSTEATGIAMKVLLDRTKPLDAGDVGHPYPGVEVRVVDPEEIPVKRGVTGQIQIRSTQLMKEYVGNLELTKEAFTDGRWFRTSDIGKISSDGRMILLGREVDAISRGTRKIYPGMLEFLLKGFKQIKEVCIVPVPDKRLYEEICVCFVPSGPLTLADVQQYCKENLFTENTVDGLGEMPSYFLQFEAFPKLGNGKPDKKAIRLDAVFRLNLTREDERNN
ncbi:medium-chain acyl-CoA ligase ACSF2, mitochondrial-like [Ylistrum balloti]|uniref:medium-chain acyl-CoA ligase ACSF2, mitochondrial-like n=1 Tax=Ylistrum balloti TaxID=509963 RepID=UPI002905A723|nr:medium-chain acyl-CoA ligase ACSF2, mitochondrial-like [Ylistrum balloti]